MWVFKTSSLGELFDIRHEIWYRYCQPAKCTIKSFAFQSTQDYLGAVAALHCEYGQAKTSNVVWEEQSFCKAKLKIAFST